jgi:hypothetical protein
METRIVRAGEASRVPGSGAKLLPSQKFSHLTMSVKGGEREPLEASVPSLMIPAGGHTHQPIKTKPKKNIHTSGANPPHKPIQIS